MNVRPQLNGEDNPLVQREGAAGDELRRQQGRDHPGRHARRRHADDLLHVIGHAAACRRPAALSGRRREGQGADEGGRLRERLLDQPAGARRQSGRDRHRHRAAADVGRAIGIKLELQQVDNATRTEQYRDGTFTMRDRAWTDDIADPNEITSYFVYSPTIDALHTGWKSEEADKLFEASQKEIDPAKRAEQYARMQEIYNTTGPIVPLYETPYPVALRKKVKGFMQIPLGNNIFGRGMLGEVRDVGAEAGPDSRPRRSGPDLTRRREPAYCHSSSFILRRLLQIDPHLHLHPRRRSSSSCGSCRAIRPAPSWATGRSTPTSSASMPASASTSPSRCSSWSSWSASLTGDLGTSIDLKVPVMSLIAQRLPVTLLLTAMAALIALALAVPLAFVAALNRARRGRRDHPRRLPGRPVDAGLLCRPGAAHGLRRRAALVPGRRLRRHVSATPLPPVPAGADAGAEPRRRADAQPARRDHRA